MARPLAGTEVSRRPCPTTSPALASPSSIPTPGPCCAPRLHSKAARAGAGTHEYRTAHSPCLSFSLFQGP